MKKFICLMGGLLIFSLLLTGCNAFAETQPKAYEETPAETPKETLPYEEDGDFVTTSDAMDYEIKCAILKEWPSANQTPDDIDIPYFYGEFNGMCVFSFETGGICAFDCQRIGEYEFIYSGGIKLDVYNSNDDEFYTLKEAYDQGFLTIENIGVIYEKFVKLNAHMYDFDENGEVIPSQKPVVEIIDGYFYIDGVNTFIKAGDSTN